MASIQTAEKLAPAVENEKVVMVVEAAVPVVNDSSEGLARMYQDLAPQAARLRSAATCLLFFSILFMGSLEGLFGLVAACGVLCCAAPGSLGVAYAARCTRISAILCASFALMHALCLSSFAAVVLPEMPQAIAKACGEASKASGVGIHADGAAPRISELFAAGLTSLDAPSTPMKHAQLEARVAGEAPIEVSGTATIVATVATTATRRLQELVQLDDVSAPAACAKTQRFFEAAVPNFLYAAVLIELGLFVSAMHTAKAAGRLIIAARSYGANAI